MKKKILIFLTTAICLIALALGLSACGVPEKQPDENQPQIEKTEGSEGLSYTLAEDGDSYVCSGMGICTETEIEIASWHNEKWVTAIGEGAFFNCTKLTGVIIPDSVTSIGESAFLNCMELTGITVGSSVTRIGKNAFGNTARYNGEFNWQNGVFYIGKYLISMKDTFSGKYSVLSDTLTIADEAFYNCTELTGVSLPDSVRNIGASAFYNCTELTGIVIPDSVKSIGDFAFFGCSKLASADLSDNVTSIGVQEFYNCASLTRVVIPDSVASIGAEAFYKCTGLESITIGESEIRIGGDAFGNTAYYNEENNWKNGVLYIRKHLIAAKTTLSGKYAVLSGTLTIADCAFYNCTGLTSVTLPDSVIGLGSDSFVFCAGLTSVTIGSGVKRIDSSAFFGCEKLTSATFRNTSGWQVFESSTATSGTDISSADLSNPATAAEYLRGTYLYYNWKRG